MRCCRHRHPPGTAATGDKLPSPLMEHYGRGRGRQHACNPACTDLKLVRAEAAVFKAIVSLLSFAPTNTDPLTGGLFCSRPGERLSSSARPSQKRTRIGYCNGSTITSVSTRAAVSSLVAGLGPRPSAKTRSCRRCPCSQPRGGHNFL